MAARDAPSRLPSGGSRANDRRSMLPTMLSSGLLALVVVAGGEARAVAVSGQAAAARCELPEPTVVRRDGTAMLQTWDLPADPVWFSATLPEAPGYNAYRVAIRQA